MPRPFAEQEKVTELPYAFQGFSPPERRPHFTFLCLRHRLPAHEPWASLLFPISLTLPGGMFSDFIIFIGKFTHWGTPAFFSIMNKAVTLCIHHRLCMCFSSLLEPSPSTRLATYSHFWLCRLHLCWPFIQVLRKQGLATMQSTLFSPLSTAFLSYPLILDFQRQHRIPRLACQHHRNMVLLH